jgi:hypothetical protein
MNIAGRTEVYIKKDSGIYQEGQGDIAHRTEGYSRKDMGL